MRPVERFKLFYQDLLDVEIDQLESVYATDVVFRDPIHEIKGSDLLHHYIDDLCANLQSCQFVYLDELVVDGSAYIKWDMHFAHKRLGKESIVVRGASHLLFEEKIHFHEDIYDMGQLLYEHLPIVGFLTRRLKQRLAK